jgi:hypothetical protein
MAFRFFRRMKIAPGVSLNLSKSGASMSFGPRGAKVTVGPRGVRETVGIPGTGMYYTTHSGYPVVRVAVRPCWGFLEAIQHTHYRRTVP